MRGKIISVIKNQKGVYGFIKCEGYPNFYYDTASIVKGNYLKSGNLVDFDIQQMGQGKIKAINVKKANTSKMIRALDSDLKETLMDTLSLMISDRGFLEFTKITKVLRNIGIDYKEYATDMSSFLLGNLGDDYEIKKPFTINGKTYPAVIIKLEKDLSEENQAKIRAKLVAVVKSNGFFSVSMFPEYLQELGISNFQDYANGLDEFLEKYVTGVFVPVKDVIYNEEVYSKVYVFDEKFNPEESTGIENAIISLEERLTQYIHGKGFFLASEFSAEAKKSGIENFREYANSVESFIDIYLHNFIVKKNVVIEDKKYPGVIVFRDENSEASNQESKLIFSMYEEDLARLRDLFESSQYEAFLSSDAFGRIEPNNLPIEYMEMALTCAYYILFPEKDKRFSLNLFQRELITNPTSLDFIKKWKSFEGFDKEIIKACAETAIASFDLSIDKKLVIKLLNNIGYSSTLNNNYVGLTKRFSACENELIPCLYLIRAFAQKSSGAIQRCISEYCQLVKDIKQSPNKGKIDVIERIIAFPHVIKSINTCLLPLESLPKNLKTNIVSVFVECDSLEDLQQLLPLLYTEGKSVESKLVDLYFDYEMCVEDDLVEIFNSNVSLQLLQKVVALIWEKHSGDKELPSQLIRLLSWIIIYNNYYSVDEILRYHFSSDFTKRHKQIMLIDSFEKICEMIQSEPEMYSLASYIDFIVVQDLSGNSILENVSTQIENWNTFSQSFYDAIIKNIGEIQFDNSQQYTKLFSLFKLDYTHYLETQKVYADWFENSSLLVGRDTYEIACILDGLFNKNAYEAYSRVFQVLDEKYISTERIEKYVASLVEMQKYTDAILFIQINTNIPIEKRNNLLSMVISENFRINEMSVKAFSIFGESFSSDDAIAALLASLKPNQYSAVSALIALYCHLEEYCKAMYLYAIYQSKSENGFTRLYSKIRGLLKSALNKVNNHYDVIELAFYTLIPNKVIEFLEWTRLIRIPEMKGYVPVHTFSKFYDALMENPHGEIVWNNFLSHLVKRLDKNAWLIFVCETVLRMELDIYVSNNSLFALKSILTNVDNKNAPYNLLPYTYLYIMQSGDTEICSLITEILKDSDIVERLVNTNIWDASYRRIKDDFKSFCMDSYGKSGADVFYHIMPLVGADLSVTELGKLAKSNVNKNYLFAEICDNYLSGRDWSETVELLNSVDWYNLSKTDKEVLNILRLVYSEDDNLLLDSNGLFETEEGVQRFKKDCANILKTYPSKEGLFEFETNCSNIVHKLSIYSYVFGAIYDEDIYDRYKLHFFDLNTPHLYNSFLHFLRRAYYAQLDWNVSYLFFYKRWRYLKLLINLMLINDDVNVDITDIISTMKENSHYDEIYQSIFVPFKNDLIEFWGFDSFSVEEKKAFLFALMQGEIGDFILHFGEALKKATNSQRNTLKRLLSYLDYREASNSIYQLFSGEIKKGYFDNAKDIAESLCDYTYDALVHIEKVQSYSDSIALFEKMAYQLTNAECINTAFKIKQFEKYSMFLIPLICSKQFIFLLYGRIRKAIINGDKSSILAKFEMIASYLVTRNVHDALTVYNYLYAMKLCIDKDREGLKSFLSSHDIKNGIPTQWLNEMGRIYQYANNNTDQFIPDLSIKDYMKNETHKGNDFTFLKRLQEHHQIQEVSLSIDDTVDLYHKLNATELSAWDRVNAGLTLLSNYPELDKNMPQGVDIPSRENLILKVGIAAIAPEANTPVNEQIEILTGLFDNRDEFSSEEVKSDIAVLNESFANVLKKSFPLYLWVRYADGIEQYLREMHNLLDFSELKNRIIIPASKFMDDSISQNDRYNGFLELMNSFNGLESVYSRNVLEAIRGECRQIENGVRLNVEIVNKDSRITDGRVYFQVENIGRRTASLSGDDIIVWFQQENQPGNEVVIQNVSNLQSGFMTGGCESVHFSDGEKNVQVSISVRMKLLSGKQELLCSKTERLFVENKANEFQVTEVTRYDVDSAVTDSDMLFGRQNLQDKLSMIIPNGASVIYGASRIGKTSLLNWVRKDLAKQKGNVISILFGGEHGLGKGKDYSTKFYDSNVPVPYDDDEKMSEYLLADTIVYTFNRRSRRLRKPESSDVSHILCDNIVHIMSDDSLSLGDRFYELNGVLEKENLELWILLDEFQDVVSRWRPERNCDFVEICQMLLNPDPDDGITNVKLIICGSDDLLRHMVLEAHSIWKEAFPKSTRVAVDPLLEKPFCDMIKQDAQIVDANIEYSDSALRALFVYTDGVALYGKEIGNAIIEDIRIRPELYRSRNIIYVSDVASATQKLINQQADELNTQAKEGISEIYGAVTKNLDPETDMQYLWYMAVWLHTNPEEDGFKESLFTQRTLLNGTQSLKDSLSIAEARGIIKNKNDQFEPVWVFRALFYYFAFVGSASRGNLREDLIFDEEEERIESDDNPYTTDRIAEQFEKMPGTTQARLIGALVGSAKDEARKKIKDLVRGNTKIVKGDEIVGDKKINNVHVNIQSITNTLNGILAMNATPASILSGLQQLPRLASYFESDELPLLLQKIESNDLEEAYAAEEKIAAGTNQMVADYRAALVSQDDIAETFCVWDILGIEKDDYYELTEKLDPTFMADLYFAAKLDSIFALIRNKNGNETEIKDFSPVSIMYCKVLEKMLKFYHTDIYRRRVPYISTEVKIDGTKIKFGDLEEENTRVIVQNKIMMGAFLFPINPKKVPENHRNWEKIANSSRDNKKQAWKSHGVMLNRAKEIRNNSAHGAEGVLVDRAMLDELKRLLLKDCGLLNIVTLCN
ncbi:hypothetical protein FMM74_003950 [Lachnospiraceae bacterium MD308]|nr:hypothetical protein [Lachnospiraceae bacterium MD308]